MEYLVILGVSVGIARTLGITTVQQVAIFIKSLLCLILILWFFGDSPWRNDSKASIPETVMESTKVYQVLTDTLPESSLPALDPTVDTGNYRDLAAFFAKKWGVDPILFAALITQETDWQPKLVSPAKAAGLAQMIPATARRYGLVVDGTRDERFIPERVLDGGAHYLSDLLKMWNGDYRLALASYNAGEGAVKKYGGIPPYRETQNYVYRVLSIYDGLQGRPPCLLDSCLSLKKGATSGGESEPGVWELARQIQNQIPIIWFSCLNDSYPHVGAGHRDGRALDVVLVYTATHQEVVGKIRDIGQVAGVKLKIIDEYANPSNKATGNHLHVEFLSTGDARKFYQFYKEKQ